ncbi:MAG: phosphate signaling complex protein PhoU [Lachnospiraceae bacterium]
MRNKFDLQLDHMNEQLIQMGELCVKAITTATRALRDGDVSLAKQVIGEDEEIDQMEKEIERLCLKLLLQQQPVAKDLRLVSAALKMITDMERIGDQAADIAEIIISAKMTEVNDIHQIVDMAKETSKMVRDSVAAFVNKDLELTRTVILSDDLVDQLFDDVKRELIMFIAAAGSQGEKAIDLIMITKYLERIGDHATNIAEWVEFSITGVHKGEKE